MPPPSAAGSESIPGWRETFSNATGVCREAVYLRTRFHAYLRTRFQRDGTRMTRASFWRKSRPRLRRENFPRRSSCVRFHHQPPKAAEFISPARQGWESRFGPEAPRGDIKILASRKKFCRSVTFARLSNSRPEAEVSATPPGSGRRPASAQPDADADRSLFPWRRLIQPAFPAQPAGLL